MLAFQRRRERSPHGCCSITVLWHLRRREGAIELARERLEAALVILGRPGERLYASRIEQTLAQVP
jgi:hypothetical protein